MEIIVVDDRSDDGSRVLLRRLAMVWPFVIIAGAGRGAAAAINVGVRPRSIRSSARSIRTSCSLAGWMARLVAELDDPASQPRRDTTRRRRRRHALCARVMGLDLEQRYAAIDGVDTDHVCTGNSVYRADALHGVGLFDERSATATTTT